jgi:HK97 family phage portal protein
MSWLEKWQAQAKEEKAAEGRSLENPSTPLDPDYDEGGPAAMSTSSSGVRVTRDRAHTYAAFWRAVNLVSRSVARLPLNVYRHVRPGKERDLKHPADRVLFRKPNEYQTPFVFKQLLQSHALTEGNGYALIERDGAARPVAMVPLNPDRTYPVRTGGRLYYVYELPGGEMRKLQAWDVFHLKGLGFDGLTGYRVLALARESLGLGLAEQRFGSKLFANSARPNVVLEVAGKMSETAKHNLRDSWERMHKGIDNAHKTAVLEDGVKVRELSINARDAQLLESKAFGLKDMANWFNVPGHKLGDNSATSYNSQEQANQEYLNDGLDPWLIAWEEEAEAKLLTEQEQEDETHCVWFDRFRLVRADLAQRGAYYSQALLNGWMNRDEVRGMEGYNPIDGGAGATYFVPANMVPLAGAEGGGGEGGGAGGVLASPEEPDGQAKLLDVPDVRQESDHDCGPAAVLAVCQFFGVEVTRAALLASLDTTQAGGTTPAAVLGTLASLGLSASAASGMTLADLTRYHAAGWPVLCPVTLYGGVGHWLVVLGVGLGQVIVHDPAVGRRLILAEQWVQDWSDKDKHGAEYKAFGIGVGKSLPWGQAQAAETPVVEGDQDDDGEIRSRATRRPRRKLKRDYNEDQPRDPDGKFASGGGGSSDDEAHDAAEQAVQDARDREDTDRDAQREREDSERDAQRDREDSEVEAKRDREDKERERQDSETESQREREDSERESQREQQDKEVEAKRDREDKASEATEASVQAARDREDSERDAQREREDQAIDDAADNEQISEADRTQQHAANDKARAKEDAARDKERDREDAAREKEQERIEKEREKEDAAAEKERDREDAAIDKERERQDAARDKQRDKEDAAREKEDAAREKAREKEDAARDKAREKEDAEIEKAREQQDKERERSAA